MTQEALIKRLKISRLGLDAVDPLRLLVDDVIAALAQPQQEPVAWTLLLTGEHNGLIGKAGEKFIGAPDYYQRVNVYTTPPQRTWVGLAAEDRLTAKYMQDAPDGIEAVIDYIEAKLKELNT